MSSVNFQWIDIKIEKPNYNFEVLICDKRGHVSTGWYRNHTIDYNDTIDYFENWDNEKYINITHWMPLPPPF